MAGSNSSSSSDDIMVDREAMIKQIHTAPVVDIQAFLSKRPIEIIQQTFNKLAKQGLHKFITTEPSNLYPEAVVEYY